MNTTRTEIPAEVNNFYIRELLERAVPAFVHLNFGMVKDLPANSGTDTVKFRRYGALSAQTTPLVEGVTPVGKQLSTTDLTAQVQYYGDYVTLTDKVQIETVDAILTETAGILGEQAGDSLDQICRDILVAGTNVQYAGSATSRVTVATTDLLDRTEIKMAVRTLKGANAKPMTSMIDPSTGFNTRPIGKGFIGIVHTDTVYDLDDAVGWVPVAEYPSQRGVMDTEVGSLAGVRFVETTNAKVFAGAGAGGIDVYATLILGARAYAITRISSKSLVNIVKPLGSGGTEDPLNQRATSGWKATFIAKILNQDWLLRIEHAVTA